MGIKNELQNIKYKIDDYIKSKVLNYKYQDKWYVMYINYFLRNNNGENLYINKINNQSRYFIHNEILKSKKYFSFRESGLYTYKQGIKKRGEKIGKDYFLDKIKFDDGDTVVDCGANIGDLKIYFENIQLNINYIGFEPGIEEYKCLELNTTINDNIFNACLGDYDGDITFYYKPEFGDSSFIKMKNPDKSYKTKISKLDTVLKNTKIKLFKVEAEGSELEVLKGSLKSLKNIEFISADLGFERGINQETTAPEVINFLLKNDFKLINVGKKRMIYLFENESTKKE